MNRTIRVLREIHLALSNNHLLVVISLYCADKFHRFFFLVIRFHILTNKNFRLYLRYLGIIINNNNCFLLSYFFHYFFFNFPFFYLIVVIVTFGRSILVIRLHRKRLTFGRSILILRLHRKRLTFGRGIIVHRLHRKRSTRLFTHMLHCIITYRTTLRGGYLRLCLRACRFLFLYCHDQCSLSFFVATSSRKEVFDPSNAMFPPFSCILFSVLGSFISGRYACLSKLFQRYYTLHSQFMFWTRFLLLVCRQISSLILCLVSSLSRVQFGTWRSPRVIVRTLRFSELRHKSFRLRFRFLLAVYFAPFTSFVTIIHRLQVCTNNISTRINMLGR
mmetsp:Transcript_3892/g.5645  ORF Transcript_3892/g.5645 Transcript_3892/m.5645 type:complete len:332 (+) Transcript_3892:1797-2792(+)